MDIEALRLLIRSKLVDGRLPVNGIPKVWGGPGRDEMCAGCETNISKDEFIIEGISLDAGGGTIRLHAKCFWLWETERKEATE
jgi:hypothetical protein